MNKNLTYVKATILDLRSIKVSFFMNRKDAQDFKHIAESCRMIDVSMLPLFYIWEYRYNMNLVDVQMEKHLYRPYKKFLQKPLLNTWVCYCFLNLGIPDLMPENIRRNVLNIYEPLIMKRDTKHRTYRNKHADSQKDMEQAPYTEHKTLT